MPDLLFWLLVGVVTLGELVAVLGTSRAAPVLDGLRVLELHDAGASAGAIARALGAELVDVERALRAARPTPRPALRYHHRT